MGCYQVRRVEDEYMDEEFDPTLAPSKNKLSSKRRRNNHNNNKN